MADALTISMFFAAFAVVLASVALVERNLLNVIRLGKALRSELMISKKSTHYGQFALPEHEIVSFLYGV
jgi:hypothetical protein